jgi:hypothetical protein
MCSRSCWNIRPSSSRKAKPSRPVWRQFCRISARFSGPISF